MHDLFLLWLGPGSDKFERLPKGETEVGWGMSLLEFEINFLNHSPSSILL